MATYTIVQNGVVTNVIEALEAFIIENFDNDVAVLGRYPIGYIFNGDHFSPPAGQDISINVNHIAPTKGYTNPSIRIITVAAFKNRLTVADRYAIRNSTDIAVSDIWDDLADRQYVDLDSGLLAEGVAYVANHLTTVPSVFNPNIMTVINATAKSNELLADGTEEEKYNGVL